MSYQATKGSYDPNTNVWNLGSLFSGEEQNLFLSGIVKSEGPYLNVAFISAQDQFDPNLDNNLATATIEAQSADLSINKVALTDSVGINELATFEIQLTNNGPDAGTNIKVQDQLPNGYNYVSSTSDYGSYNEETGIWSLGNLDTAQTATLNITATVIHNGLYNNTASIIDADQADPVADNNISSAAVVPVLADLSLSMTASNTKPKIGEAVGFTVGLNNLGPINASNIQVTDIIPNGFVFQSFTATSGNYDPNR